MPSHATYHTSRKVSRFNGHVAEMDLFGPVEPSRTGATYMFVAAIPTTKSSPYIYACGIRNKTGTPAAIESMLIDLNAHGITISAAISDAGGEFSGRNTLAVLRRFGVYSECRPSQVHALRAEASIRRNMVRT